MANRVLRYDKGIVSIPGPQGEQGPEGAVGPQGPKGDTGERGLTGPAGATGPRGDTGLRGEPGAIGATGATGARGEQGLRGLDGPQGATGPKGDKGDKGDTGPAGAASTIPGPQGPKGDTGPAGPAGTPGIPGQAGSSIADFRNENGTLTIEMSDGYFFEAFLDEGSGGSGTPGQDGVSVDYAEIDSRGHLILTLSDGSTLDAGVAKGDAGETGPQGPAGVDGEDGIQGPAGADGQGVPTGGQTGQILVKTDNADFATTWTDFPFEQIQQMIDDAIAAANGGGTDPEPEPEPVDPSDMTTVRWTANGTNSPIPASVAGWNDAVIAGETAPTANGTNLALVQHAFLDFGTVAFNMPESSDYLLNQTPSVLRLAFKGKLIAEAGRVIDFMHWANSSIKFAVPWMGDRLMLAYTRASEGQPEVGEEVHCIGDFKLGEDHLYEVIWTNDASGTGGSISCYVDSVQVGESAATAYKLRTSNDMLMNCNASMGNTSDGRAIEMEYIEIGFKA